MNWENMTDQEIIEWFAQPVYASDIIPAQFQYGVRRCLQILAKSSIEVCEFDKDGNLKKI